MSNNSNIIKLDWFNESDKKDLSNYLCKICNGIYNYPVLLSCGNIICKECYKLNNKKCLICGEANISIISENLPYITSYLSKKTCKCKNEGCNKELNIKNILIHLEKCPKEILLCKYNCGSNILRENIESHELICNYRPCQCKYCKKEIVHFKNLENHLDKECNLYYLKCKFCGEKILKKNIDNHLNFKCKNTDKKCILSIIGCTEKIPPNGNEEHLEIYKIKHIELLSQFLLDINNKAQNLLKRINIIGKKNKRCLNKLKSNFELKQNQKFNLNNVDNSISYSIALDEEEVEEIINEKNKKDMGSLKMNKNKNKKKRE